jgi:hypothetical protein
MENNPYNNNYHAYLESLKANLDKADSYVNSGYKTEVEVVENVKTKTSLLKLGLIYFGTIVIGISVISFLTQGFLFVFDKDKNPALIVVQTDQEKVEDELKKIYVRADLNKDVFSAQEEATTTLSTSSPIETKEVFDITKYTRCVSYRL